MRKVVLILCCLVLIGSLAEAKTVKKAPRAPQQKVYGSLPMPPLQPVGALSLQSNPSLTPPGITPQEQRLYVSEENQPVQVGGLIYFRYQKYLQNGTVPSNFDVDRVYLDFKKIIDRRSAVRVTFDVGRLDASIDPNKKSQQLFDFLKYAYAELAVNSSAALKIGLQQTAWIDWEDKVLGLRYIAKTILDNEGIMPSADFGVGAVGTITSPGGGAVEYQATLMNGTGYRLAENDNKKNAALRMNATLFENDQLGSIIAGAFGQLKGISSAQLAGDSKLAGALLGWKTTRSVIYGELIRGAGISAYSFGAKYSFLPGWGLFGRHDNYDPNINSETTEIQRNFYGVTYDYSNNIKFALDVQTVLGGPQATVSPNATTSAVYLHCMTAF